MSDTGRLRIPQIAAAQAQKHVTHNEAMVLLDTLVQLAVLDKDLSAPPGTPEEGDTYIVAGQQDDDSASGAWLGWEGRVTRYIDGAWRSYLPGAGDGAGWRAWVIDENAFYVFDGAEWSPLAAGGAGGGLPRGHIFGLQLAAMDGNEITVSAGEARADENDFDLVLPAALTKDMNAGFAKGDDAGGLGTGVVLPASGSLHVFAITEQATGDADIYGDVSVDGANVPAGWSVRRRIFSLITDAGADLVHTSQHGDLFNTGILTSYNETSGFPETGAAVTLDVPAGIVVRPLVYARAEIDGNATAAWFLLPGDATADTDRRQQVLAATNMDGQTPVGAILGSLTTDMAAQMKHYVSVASRFASLQIRVNGWIDARGRTG